MKVDSVRELVTMIKKDKSLEEEISKDPAKAIAKIAESLRKTEMSKKLCFCWGFFGAALPEIIRLQKIVINATLKTNFFSINYFLISLIFFCAAGFLSIAWKPESPYRAIWLGAAFPVIISTIAVQVPSLPG